MILAGAAIGTAALITAKSDAIAGSSSAVAVPAGDHPAAGLHTSCGSAKGPLLPTPHGAIQVRITVARGRVTDVATVVEPVGGRSTEVNEYALPILRQEVLVAQSADVAAVSGATYTSESYRESVRAAMDNAT